MLDCFTEIVILPVRERLTGSNESQVVAPKCPGMFPRFPLVQFWTEKQYRQWQPPADTFTEESPCRE